MAEEYVLDVAGRSVSGTSPDKVFFSGNNGLHIYVRPEPRWDSY
jgi:hypothetical protein